MKLKNKILFISVIIAIIVIASLQIYNSFALPEKIEENNYTFKLNGTKEIDIAKYSNKTVYYQIHNTNSGTVKYGVGYKSDTGKSIVTVYEASDSPSIGLINKNEYKYVKLRITNLGDTPDTVTLSTVLGYKNGGDLIPNAGVTIVTENPHDKENTIFNSSVLINNKDENINNDDYKYFYDINLERDKIESIEFTTLTNIPSNVEFIDISEDKDQSALLWYEDLDKNNLYEVFIGTISGKTKLNNDASYMFYNLTNLVLIDLTGLDTSNITDMSHFFENNSKIDKLDLTGFDFTKVITYNNIFDNTSKDIEIIVKDCKQYKIFKKNYTDSDINLHTIKNEDCSL